MVTSCETRVRFRACGRAGIAICQYCGRSFCDDHGSQLEDGQEICGRTTCRRKKADLEQHLIYKGAVAARNRQRFCGFGDCGEGASGQCSKCQGLFCLRHLEERVIEERRDAASVRLRASLCRHCLKRRAIWARA